MCPEVRLRFGVDEGYSSRGGFEFPMGSAQGRGVERGREDDIDNDDVIDRDELSGGG